MISPTLLILAAGMGNRYGGLKQTASIGPHGEAILDYSIFDALRAGFGKVVFVLRRPMEQSFREIYVPRLQSRAPMQFVFQELDTLPSGFHMPAGRTKPWGTTHAVLMAANVIHEPFAVINADDFYGAESFRVLSKHLQSGAENYAMAGFTLRQTLSEFGKVARGVCEVDNHGYLRSVTEFTSIERNKDRVVNKDASGLVTPLSGNGTTSMNMWAFTPLVFAQLQASFIRFLEVNGSSLSAECYLPTTVNELIHTGAARVKVLPTRAAWFGVTYREDHARVTQNIAHLIRAGNYPERLWS